MNDNLFLLLQVSVPCVDLGLYPDVKINSFLHGKKRISATVFSTFAFYPTIVRFRITYLHFLQKTVSPGNFFWVFPETFLSFLGFLQKKVGGTVIFWIFCKFLTSFLDFSINARFVPFQFSHFMQLSGV